MQSRAPASRLAHSFAHRRLVNVGNTCWRNASLQLLSACDGLPALAQYPAATAADADTVRSLTASALCRLSTPGSACVAPSSLKKLSELLFPGQTGIQQDADEAIFNLLNWFPDSDVLFEIVSIQDKQCLECGGASKIDEVETKMVLQLVQGATSLEHLIGAAFKTDRIVVDCDDCGSRDEAAIRKKKLMSASRNLLIVLARFIAANDSPSRKQTQSIFIPLQLGISPERGGEWEGNVQYQQITDRMKKSPKQHDKQWQYLAEQPLLYQLTAVILHHGASKNSGHYTALVHEEEKWIHCNDSTVKMISEQEALEMANKEAYMCLFTAQ